MFTSILHDCPLSATSTVYGIDYLSFPSVYLSIRFYRSTFMLSHDLLFFFFSVCLPVYPSIYLSRLFTRLSVCLLILSRFFRNKPFYRHFLLLTTFRLILHSGDSSKFSHLSRERNRINRISVKEANLSSAVTLHFSFRLFAKPCGNFVTSNHCNRGQTKLRFFWFHHYKLHIIVNSGAVKYRSFHLGNIHVKYLIALLYRNSIRRKNDIDVSLNSWKTFVALKNTHFITFKIKISYHFFINDVL